ncbi:hypothetical protein ZTR_05234 [Talaromyces verruculosus]|nr:hypothetical protein ZTR_05234 [Talaromyces verruculosus]
MIRSFPRGFYCPIPHAWMPPADRFPNSTDPLPWAQEDDKKKWRGFGIILQQLAKQEHHNITEFVIDTKELKTGISCRIFNESGEDYDNLVTLLQQPGFKHLDLALVADGQDYTQQRQTIHTLRGQQPWSSFQSGLLKEALEKIKNSDHVSIRVRLDERWCYNYL